MTDERIRGNLDEDGDVSLIEMRENFVVAGDTNYYLPAGSAFEVVDGASLVVTNADGSVHSVWAPSAWTLAWAAGAKVRVEGQRGRRRR